VLVLGRRQWAVTYVRHRRARHYILRVAEDGSLRVTIPRGGSRKDAERFARQKADWVDREQYRRHLARGSAGPLWDARFRPQAARELPARLMELAASHGHRVAGVTVRNQRSRWGSCSPSGRISLNWRLIQAPPSVRDYVLLHELTHLAVSNHSPKFWKALEAVCPWHRDARAWLRARSIMGCD
jgi:predicted metal-dependent hydrolase